MNDEIKEIFNDTKEFIKDLDDKSIYGIPISELRQLLDYITNLEDTLIDKQECIDAYSEIINNRDEKITNLQQIEEDHKQANAVLMQELTNLEIENERLKAIWKDTNVIVKDNKTLVMNTNAYDTLEDYKSRCEKAIEYIKNDWYSKNTVNIDNVVIGNWRIDLLNILQNGSEEK